jgi:carboxyl-terminal processing protease
LEGAARRGRHEADLRGALDNKQSEKSDPKTKDGEEKGADKKTEADSVKKKPKPVDYQLARALDLLRGLALYRNRMVN